MGGISSGTTPYVFTTEQLDGTLHTEAWLQWEFQDTYASGGISLSYSGATPSLSGMKDVGMYFKYIKDMQVTAVRPLLGLSLYSLAANPASLDHAVASGYPMMQAYIWGLSGIAAAEFGASSLSGFPARLHIIGY